MIMGGRLLGNVKDFEMSKNGKWIFFLVHPSRLSVSFTGLELFYNSVNCRKLIVMQMIIVHKNVNKFYLVPHHWFLSCGYLPVLYLFVNSFQHSWSPIYARILIILWTNFNSLLAPSLINELNKAFHKYSLYICMTVMILTLLPPKK